MVDNGYELSSPLSFPSSSCVSNGGSAGPHEAKNNLELLSLSKLSSGLEKLLVETEFGLYYDWEIVVEGVSVGVNRCILAARSQFFHEKFKTAMAEGKPPKFVMADLLPRPLSWVGFEAFEILLNYLYTGKLKVSPPEVSTCVDVSCDHLACRPAINYAVGLLYASSTFQMNELVMLLQRHLVDIVDKALAEDVIPVLMVAYHCSLGQLLEHCLEIVTRSDLDNFTLEKELQYEIFNNIRARRLQSQQQQRQQTQQAESLKETRIKRILKALDCDDVDLLKLLLAESTVTLDDACALHYAVAYCNSKVVMEVLGLRMADVNLLNPRGHTPLHVAARRKDPAIIVGLLKHGASVGYGHDVVATCRRVTRPKDYNEPVKQGQETNKDRLCIDVLEREMSQDPTVGNSFLSSPNVADELFMGLYLLENRVALARQLFPREARLAMEQAEADSTLEFAGLSSTNGFCGNPRGVGLNDLPSDQVRRLEERREALQKTVETGQRFFPKCSEVLDRLLEDEVLECLMLESGTAEEQRFKKARYIELKEEVHNAFVKDKAEHMNWSHHPSFSSSSTSAKSRKVRKR